MWYSVQSDFVWVEKMGKMNKKKFMEMLIIWPNYSLSQINLWMVDIISVLTPFIQ